MAKVAVIIDDMFEDIEYTSPVNALKKEGHKVINIGLKENSVVKGKKKGTPVRIDKSPAKAKVEDFDALLIPGGYSPDKLRSHHEAVNFVKKFVKSGKPVFMICHGPQLLITADVLKGRKITGWKSIIQDIKNAGAEFVDKSLVVDGNLVSSRSPRDLPDFIRALLKLPG